MARLEASGSSGVVIEIMRILGLDRRFVRGFSFRASVSDIPTMEVWQYVEETGEVEHKKYKLGWEELIEESAQEGDVNGKDE